MAEETEIHPPVNGEATDPTANDVQMESDAPAVAYDDNGSGKRVRGEGESEEGDQDSGAAKKPRLEESLEEGGYENLETGKEGEGEEKVSEAKGGVREGAEGSGDEKLSVPVSLGPKSFSSAVEMFDYFYKFLHYWPPNIDISKYEHMVLLELIKKGHSEPEKKIGEGVEAFQVRYHPMWKSRCFFVTRVDGSVDDFSFRKCVDRILPLPENMKTSFGNKIIVGYQRGGGQGRGGRGSGIRGGRGRGRRGGFGK